MASSQGPSATISMSLTLKSQRLACSSTKTQSTGLIKRSSWRTERLSRQGKWMSWWMGSKSHMYKYFLMVLKLIKLLHSRIARGNHPVFNVLLAGLGFINQLTTRLTCSNNQLPTRRAGFNNGLPTRLASFNNGLPMCLTSKNFIWWTSNRLDIKWQRNRYSLDGRL